MNGIGSGFGLGKWPCCPPDGEENAMGKLAQRMIKEQDADKSGDLTLDETKLSQEGFNNIDRNGDSKISRDEIAEGLQEKKGDLVTILQDRADEMQTYGPPKGRIRSMAAHVMNQLDTDNSRDLTLAETGLEEDSFAKVDSDGDSVLSADEIATAIRDRMDEALTFLDEITRPDHEGSKGQAKKALQKLTTGLMDELDSNEDGGINQEESTLSEELFTQLDTNGDGVLSSEEIAQALRDQPELARGFLTNIYGEGAVPGLPENWIDHMADGLMKAFDRNRSGDLNLEESGLKEEAFASIDANESGTVTADELSDAISARSEASREMGDNFREEHPHRDPRIRRAMASYQGNMAELMAEVFKDNEDTES